MDYYISRNQETYGPYTDEEINAHLESGSLSPSDHAWREGEDEWKPLCELIASDAQANSEQHGSPLSGEKPTGSTDPHRPLPEKSSSDPVESDRRGGFRGGRILAITVGIILLGYLASPYLCLILLNRALGSGDLSMVGRLVDFPSLREELHKEASAKRENPGSPDRQDSYLGVAPEAVPEAVQYIEQRYLTPSGLSSLLSRPELAVRERSAGTFASMTAQSIDPSRLRWAFFTGPTEFVADLDGLKLTFRVSGAFWRLERISFP